MRTNRLNLSEDNLGEEGGERRPVEHLGVRGVGVPWGVRLTH